MPGRNGNERGVRPRLHHVNLKTTRLQEMIDWYGKVVGTEVIHQYPGGAWLSNDEANHRIALLHSPRLQDDPEKLLHTGIHHVAFEYESLDQLLHSYEALKEEDVEPHMSLDHGMTVSLYFVDPDGNSVELQSDNFGDWEKSKEFMLSSPEFEKDPIGTPFDPQKMLDALKSGITEAELHRRAYAGEWPIEIDLRVPL